MKVHKIKTIYVVTDSPVKCKFKEGDLVCVKDSPTLRRDDVEFWVALEDGNLWFDTSIRKLTRLEKVKWRLSGGDLQS